MTRLFTRCLIVSFFFILFAIELTRSEKSDEAGTALAQQPEEVNQKKMPFIADQSTISLNH